MNLGIRRLHARCVRQCRRLPNEPHLWRSSVTECQDLTPHLMISLQSFTGLAS